jgi:hypothetical protein
MGTRQVEGDVDEPLFFRHLFEMTEEDEQAAVARSSSPERSTTSEESDAKHSIALLINSTPLLGLGTDLTPLKASESTPRSRRRSSISILQSLVTSTNSLATNDARKR